MIPGIAFQPPPAIISSEPARTVLAFPMDPQDNRRSGRKRLHSFADAFRGLTHALQTEPNARIHTAIALGVLAAGWALHISAGEWVAIVLCIGLVFAAECFNTALEALADAVAPDPHPLVARAKDAAAGAVLLAAIGAGVIGLLVLGPHALVSLRGS